MDAATNVIAEVKQAAALAIASTYAFRTFNGTAETVAAALTRVYVEQSPLEHGDALEALGNIAIVAPANGITLARVGSPATFRPQGAIVVEFRRWPTKNATQRTADPGAWQRSFDNWMGALMQSGDAGQPGLVELLRAGGEGMLDFDTLMAEGPYRVDPEDVARVGNVELYYLEMRFGGR